MCAFRIGLPPNRTPDRECELSSWKEDEPRRHRDTEDKPLLSSQCLSASVVLSPSLGGHVCIPARVTT